MGNSDDDEHNDTSSPSQTDNVSLLSPTVVLDEQLHEPVPSTIRSGHVVKWPEN